MAASDFGPADLFVSPNGKDSWSGTQPEVNDAGTDGPLATLQAAQMRIRQRKGLTAHKHDKPVAAGLDGASTVWLRGGRYPLTEPLVFTPADTAPVTYKAYPDETPILDGGTRISDWELTTHKGQEAWVAHLPEVAKGEWHFRELFVNGKRRARPRRPKQGLFQMVTVPGLPEHGGWGQGGYTQFICNDGEVEAFANLHDVEVVYVHFWIEERSSIAAFDAETRLVTMARPSRAPLFGSHGSHLADYYVDNVLEDLDTPGEWYLDRDAGTLIYLPLPGETPDTTEVYAPRLLQLLVLRGNPDTKTFVEFLRFEGLTLQHTDWRHPDVSDGAVCHRPSGEHAQFESRRHFRGHHAAASQAACDVPGVVFMEAARHCALVDCTIEHVGWYGVEIADGCWGIRVVGNTLQDMGAGGVKINGASATDPHHRRTGNHRITDNVIRAGGRIFHSAVGILCMNAFENELSHNHIHDLFYSGISCGWVWGYHESVSRDNRIEKNHIHDIGQGLLSDMGGIYTLGVQPGTVLRDNLIHDIQKAHYGAWCIYPDEGSSHLVIENNVCFRTNDTIFHQHYGRENMVRNNIFAFGDAAILAHGKVDAFHRAMHFERNLFITNGTPIFQAGYGCRLEDRNHASDLNLLWDVGGAPLTFTAKGKDTTLDLDAWQSLGHDRHSLVADPKCKDPTQGDFALASDSPAAAIGFAPIDLSDVGVRPKEKQG